VWPRGWVEIQLYSSMTMALEVGEWSAARPGHTLPPGKTRYPFHRRLGLSVYIFIKLPYILYLTLTTIQTTQQHIKHQTLKQVTQSQASNITSSHCHNTQGYLIKSHSCGRIINHFKHHTYTTTCFDINTLKTKRRLLYLKTQSVTRSKLFSS